jgi:hypothetical protein
MMLLGAEPTVMIIQIMTMMRLALGKTAMMVILMIRGTTIVWITKIIVDYDL